VRTFQARLTSRLNSLHRKLADNAISWMGVSTDCIRITLKKDNVGDIVSRTVDGLDVVEVIFPNIIDVPMWRFISSDGTVEKRATVINDPESPLEPFECYAPATSKIDQDDLLIKFFDNPANENPLVIVLQVKDVLGSFGQRSILFMKLKATYYDGNLPEFIVNSVLDMATRRATLKW